MMLILKRKNLKTWLITLASLTYFFIIMSLTNGIPEKLKDSFSINGVVEYLYAIILLYSNLIIYFLFPIIAMYAYMKETSAEFDFEFKDQFKKEWIWIIVITILYGLYLYYISPKAKQIWCESREIEYVINESYFIINLIWSTLSFMLFIFIFSAIGFLITMKFSYRDWEAQLMVLGYLVLIGWMLKVLLAYKPIVSWSFFIISLGLLSYVAFWTIKKAMYFKIGDSLFHEDQTNRKELKRVFNEIIEEQEMDTTSKSVFSAAYTVVQYQLATTSILQRRLKMPYAEAMLMLEKLEELKIIGSYNPKKPRDVLIKDVEALFDYLYKNSKEGLNVIE